MPLEWPVLPLDFLLMPFSSNAQSFIPDLLGQAITLLLSVGLTCNSCTLVTMCTGDLSRKWPRLKEFAS